VKSKMMLRRVFWGCLVMAWVFVFYSPVFGQTSNLPPAAEGLCQELFNLLDQGRLKESYELTSPGFQKLESRESWHGRMISERESIGRAQSRRLIKVEKTSKFADLPEGDYLVAVFETRFDTHPDSVETVVMESAGSGKYGLVWYQVRYNMWPEAVAIIGNGLLLVFFIMSLLAVLTWLVGRIIQTTAKKKAAAEKAEKG